MDDKKLLLNTFDSMDEPFDIPVLYKNQELFFTATFLSFGYVNKFRVDVYGQEIFFELDDSGEYRALVNTANMEEAKKTDIQLLKAIADSITFILK